MRRLEAATECLFLVSLQLPLQEREVVYELLHAGGSVADWLGKPLSDGGRGIGSGVVAALLAVTMAAVVAVLAWQPALQGRRGRP